MSISFYVLFTCILLVILYYNGIKMDINMSVFIHKKLQNGKKKKLNIMPKHSIF